MSIKTKKRPFIESTFMYVLVLLVIFSIQYAHWFWVLPFIVQYFIGYLAFIFHLGRIVFYIKDAFLSKKYKQILFFILLLPLPLIIPEKHFSYLWNDAPNTTVLTNAIIVEFDAELESFYYRYEYGYVTHTGSIKLDEMSNTTLGDSIQIQYLKAFPHKSRIYSSE